MDKAPTNQTSPVSHHAGGIGNLRLRDWRLEIELASKSLISNLRSPFFALKTKEIAQASASIVSGKAIMWACRSP